MRCVAAVLGRGLLAGQASTCWHSLAVWTVASARTERSPGPPALSPSLPGPGKLSLCTEPTVGTSTTTCTALCQHTTNVKTELHLSPALVHGDAGQQRRVDEAEPRPAAYQVVVQRDFGQLDCVALKLIITEVNQGSERVQYLSAPVQSPVSSPGLPGGEGVAASAVR